MKVVHVIDYFQPQLGYQETFLAREHARLGHDVYVVTSDRYNPILYAGDTVKSVMGKRLVSAGYFVEEGIKVWRLKTLFELPHAIRMLGFEKKIRELKPELVIMHGIVNFNAIKLAKLRLRYRNFKLIYDDHMTFDNSTSKMSILYPFFKQTFSPFIQKSADALVGVADACKNFMNRRYGIPLERISVIPLGADEDLFTFSSMARQQLRIEFGISESDILFIYTGKIIPTRKLEILIMAVKDLSRKHANIRVLLVGDGQESYIEVLKQRISDHHLENLFIFHKAVLNKELPPFYSAADVAVWPRGASISQREAISCNLPLILSDGSLVDELIEYNNGFTFREEDAVHLSQQMEKLLDANLRRKMGCRSRKLVVEKLSWRIIARQFLVLV